MEWDLGLTGIGALLAMSVAFGLVAQLLVGRNTTPYLRLIGALGAGSGAPTALTR